MKFNHLLPFLRSIPAILAYFLPAALLLAFFKAWFLNDFGRQYNGTLLAGIVGESGILLAVCVWLGIRASWQKQIPDSEVSPSPKGIRWLAVAWSLLLSVFLNYLYEICFCFGMSMLASDKHGNKVPFVTIFTNWLPDPRYVGIAGYLSGIIIIEMFTCVAIFLTSLISYLTLYRRLQERTYATAGRVGESKPLSSGGEG